MSETSRKSSVSTLPGRSSVSLGAAARHTPEPWEVTTGRDISGFQVFIRNDAGATIGKTFDVTLGTQEPNARRIVACVNACQGVDDPQAMIDEARRMAESLVFYLAQSGSEGPALAVTKGIAQERAKALLAKLRGEG